jgi:hypothetical protein
MKVRGDFAQIVLKLFLRCKRLYIATDTEPVARAAQQHRTNARITCTAQSHRHQLFGHLQVQGIARLRTVERDVSNIVTEFKKNRIVRHRLLLACFARA